eukprot:c10903_g1_i2.p1 GENE.c10903_g1_i2~~c10903_g1_i2.p1  ORF type:complete len:103 (-),score=14.07 c10903_g1_i2:525-833(-)
MTLSRRIRISGCSDNFCHHCVKQVSDNFRSLSQTHQKASSWSSESRFVCAGMLKFNRVGLANFVVPLVCMRSQLHGKSRLVCPKCQNISNLLFYCLPLQSAG